jgi:hypothetical protein
LSLNVNKIAASSRCLLTPGSSLSPLLLLFLKPTQGLGLTTLLLQPPLLFILLLFLVCCFFF